MWWKLNNTRQVPSNDIFHDICKQTLHVATISSCNCLPHCRTRGGNPDPLLLSSRLSQVSLWWENVNVSFIPVLSFIMIKQFILREKGGGERNASSSFIHRLSCFIHTLVILYHAPLSSRQEANLHWNKSLIFCFLISFFLPVVSPISLFILHMWLPAC